MAKLFKTYSINPKYTNPFRVKFYIYLAGMFEGFGDISYYSIIINNNQEEREVKRYNFHKSDLAKIQKEIIEYISFIECDKFDIISRKEFEFITTDTFYEISSLLHCQSIKFNDNFSMCELNEKLFSTNNIGKKFYPPVSYYKSTTTGRVLLKWNDTTIQIPFAKSSNNNIIEVKSFSCQINIFKIIFFINKLYLISRFLYDREYFSCGPRGWKETFLNSFSSLEHFNWEFQKKCPYYKII